MKIISIRDAIMPSKRYDSHNSYHFESSTIGVKNLE
jgi:hypothetical protein